MKVMGLGREGAQPDSLSQEEIRELGLSDREQGDEDRPSYQDREQRPGAPAWERAPL